MLAPLNKKSKKRKQPPSATDGATATATDANANATKVNHYAQNKKESVRKVITLFQRQPKECTNWIAYLDKTEGAKT